MSEKNVAKKFFAAIVSLLLIFALGGCSLISEPIEEKEDSFTPTLEVHYIDVGQGDCSLIICDEMSLLIDAGENGHESEVINYLYSLGIEKLDYIIATHQHSDHIGGLPEVIEEFGADTVIMPKLTKELTPTSKTYSKFLEAIKNTGTKGVYSKVGSVYQLGDSQFEILAPIDSDVEDINSMSVIIKLTHGDNTFMFTGDAESDEEMDVVDSGADIDCDVLKVGHHGSRTSSCDEFIDAVSPEICVIMCGEDNSYGHPHEETLETLDLYTDEIYRTDICGSVVISSDGEYLDVSYENE